MLKIFYRLVSYNYCYFLASPTIEATPEKNNVVVIEDHSLTLECKPRGNPFPDVTWLKNEIDILGSTESELTNVHLMHNTQRLRLENVKLKNHGQYTCVATNSVGVAKHQFNLKVIGTSSFQKY